MRSDLCPNRKGVILYEVSPVTWRQMASATWGPAPNEGVSLAEPLLFSPGLLLLSGCVNYFLDTGVEVGIFQFFGETEAPKGSVI